LGTLLQTIASVVRATGAVPLDPAEVLETAAAQLTRAVASALRAADPAIEQLASYRLGHILYEMGRYDEAEQRLRDASGIRVGVRNAVVEYLIQQDLGDCALVRGDPFEQEAQGERRLAGAGVALDEVDAVGGQPAAQDVIQPLDAGRDGGRVSAVAAHSLALAKCVARLCSRDQATNPPPSRTARSRRRRCDRLNEVYPLASIMPHLGEGATR